MDNTVKAGISVAVQEHVHFVIDETRKHGGDVIGTLEAVLAAYEEGAAYAREILQQLVSGK